jgi:flagellar biosynthesis/type III secretory pathway M-ring protein FliF/YscJ
MVRKLILAGIAVAALAGVLSRPTMVPVIDAPVTDEAAWSRIMTRINQEGVKTLVSSGGVISVENRETARKMRSILIRDDLIPPGTDLRAVFGRERWTFTDYKRNGNFRRAITAMVAAQIKSQDEADNANVVIRNTWSMAREMIQTGIAVAGVLSRPAMVPVIDAPITDEAAWSRIMTRINQEGVETLVSAGGVISVKKEETARKMRSILIRDDLIPPGTDLRAVFGCDPRTITDYERDVNFHRAITAMVTAHIESLDEVDNANVMLITVDENPVTASVILTLRPGSDIRKKKIEGVQKLLKYAVEGLADENIVITDNVGLILNDFSVENDNRVAGNFSFQTASL